MMKIMTTVIIINHYYEYHYFHPHCKINNSLLDRTFGVISPFNNEESQNNSKILKVQYNDIIFLEKSYRLAVLV